MSIKNGDEEMQIQELIMQNKQRIREGNKESRKKEKKHLSENELSQKVRKHL